MTWAIKREYGPKAVEVVKETEKCVFYLGGWRGTEAQTRSDKGAFYTWRGDETTAKVLAQKLESAKAEYNRRAGAASDWYKAREAAIFGEGANNG